MMGFSFTSTTALAMECEREHAGTASALSSAVGFGWSHLGLNQGLPDYESGALTN